MRIFQKAHFCKNAFIWTTRRLRDLLHTSCRAKEMIRRGRPTDRPTAQSSGRPRPASFFSPCPRSMLLTARTTSTSRLNTVVLDKCPSLISTPRAKTISAANATATAAIPPSLSRHQMRLVRPVAGGAAGAAGAAAAASLSLFAAFQTLQQPATVSAFSIRGLVRKMSTSDMSSSAANSAAPDAAVKKASSSDAAKQTSGDDANGGGSSSPQQHPLDPLSQAFDHSWINHLDPESESSKRKAVDYSRHSSLDDDQFNKSKRPVFNGHYVEVPPTPLKNPRLVIHSSDMARRLGLSDQSVHSEEFTKFFSGDVTGALDGLSSDTASFGATWATPYALSIMGTRYTSNCPWGTGDGYGDGRAISIGEVTVPKEHADHPASPRYEMQLKGAGRTPFCRGADGRAVLRSSIREFLASEAMHHLGVKTTRALSLVVSEGPNGDTSMRPWYSEGNKRELPSMDDPRLAQYTDAQKKQILSQLQVQARDNPDIMIEEPCAITCRVSPSFVRIGHLDLFARRATKNAKEDSVAGGKQYDTTTPEWEALEKMIWHAAYREFPQTAYEPYKDDEDIGSAAKALLKGSMDSIATMVAGWIRVGFTQGNFNADNCLVGGRTMDYGPFGFVDEYHPLYAKWTGSGEHFGFLNQPQAGFTNFAVMVESVLPVISAHCGAEETNTFREELMAEGAKMFQGKVDEVFRAKLGFHPSDEAADELWAELEPLFRESRVDWTMFWRQLYEVVKQFPVTSDKSSEPSTEYGDMLNVLLANDCKKAGSSPFYEKLSTESRAIYLKWIQKWRQALIASYKEGGASTKGVAADAASASGEVISCQERMRLANPKYILREPTLVEAYGKAANGDEYMVKELLDLVEHPYDEGTEEQSEKYYRRVPDAALKAGGTAYMS